MLERKASPTNQSPTPFSALRLTLPLTAKGHSATKRRKGRGKEKEEPEECSDILTRSKTQGDDARRNEGPSIARKTASMRARPQKRGTGGIKVPGSPWTSWKALSAGGHSSSTRRVRKARRRSHQEPDSQPTQEAGAPRAAGEMKAMTGT
jgi:hypothetical protein